MDEVIEALHDPRVIRTLELALRDARIRRRFRRIRASRRASSHSPGDWSRRLTEIGNPITDILPKKFHFAAISCKTTPIA